MGLDELLEGVAILKFIWMLDVLFRRRPPWTATRIPPPPGFVDTRTPTRPKYPDHGEFGRFELLILSAYAWLAFAAAMLVITGATAICPSPALAFPVLGNLLYTATPSR